MPITIVSGNLNFYGDNGQFETDPSTWWFPVSNTSIKILRSNIQKYAGLYSAQVKALNAVSAKNYFPPSRNNFTAGKKYIIKAKIFVPSSAPIATAGAVLSIYNGGEGSFFNTVASVTKTVTEATDTWVEISRQVEWLFTSPLSFWLKHSDANSILNGIFYFDAFEVYEYVDDADPGPPPPEGETFDQVFFSRNPMVFAKTAPAGWDSLINFRLYNDIRVQDDTGSGVYNSKMKDALYPESDGTVKFYLREAFPFPDVLKAIPPVLNASSIIRLTDRIKFFKNYSGQLTGTDTVPSEETLTASNRMLVLLGGVNKQKYPGLNFFTTYLTANKKFLSWAPVEKTVDRLQEDYLNFWVYNPLTTTVKVRIKVYYDDGTNATQVVNTLTPVLYGYLLQIPVGPYNSGVAAINPAKNMVKYELSLLDQDNAVISEVRTYKIAPVRHPLTRFIMFLNSLGTYEVILITGQAEHKTGFAREVVQRFLPHDYAVEDGELSVNSTSLQENMNYSTGYFKGRYAKEWQQYMKDLLLSRKIYDVTDGNRIPISVTSAELDGGTDQVFMRFARVDVQKAFIDDCYTPDVI